MVKIQVFWKFSYYNKFKSYTLASNWKLSKKNLCAQTKSNECCKATQVQLAINPYAEYTRSVAFKYSLNLKNFVFYHFGFKLRNILGLPLIIILGNYNLQAAGNHFSELRLVSPLNVCFFDDQSGNRTLSSSPYICNYLKNCRKPATKQKLTHFHTLFLHNLK